MMDLINGKSQMLKKRLWQALANLKMFSLFGWARFIILKMQRKSISVVGQCSLCGKCCRKISLEVRGGWIRTEKQFFGIVRDYPEYARFVIDGKDGQGFLQFSCNWCTDEGVCRDHSNRLSICRNFPDISLYFCGGEVPMGCGYTFKKIVPFSKILDSEIKRKQ